MFLLIIFLSFLVFVKADEIDDIGNAMKFFKKDLSSKEVDYQSLSTKLSGIKIKLNSLEKDITQKELEVKKGEEVLTYQKELFNERAKSYYKMLIKARPFFEYFGGR